MEVTLKTILRAKSELALRVTHPFAKSRPLALRQILATFDLLHKHINNQKTSEAHWFLNDPTCAAYALLRMQCWCITNPTEKTPDLLKLTPDQLTDWLTDWQNRLSAWTSKNQLFETDKSWTMINKFLDVWYEQIVYHKIPHGRGCADWLRRNNVIPVETTTQFDNTFYRTVISPNQT